MTKHRRDLALVIGLLMFPVGSASAQDLTAVEKRCTIAEVRAIAAHSRCVARAEEKGIKKGLSESEVDDRVAECGARLFAKF